jgi:large subunit ribosomal protein L25
MADDNKLVAEIRTVFGKGAARRIRAVGKIPAVIYGHGTEPQHVTLPNHEVSLILRKANAVLDLDIEGKSQLALVKDVQKDPVRQIIEHIDLVIVRKGEKVTIDIPIHVIGEAAPGNQVLQDANTVSIEAEATNIPERLTVDIEGLTDGTQIRASDITRRSSPIPTLSSSVSPARPIPTSANPRRRRTLLTTTPKRPLRRSPKSRCNWLSSGDRQWTQTSGLWSGSVIPGPATPETATMSGQWLLPSLRHGHPPRSGARAATRLLPRDESATPVSSSAAR